MPFDTTTVTPTTLAQMGLTAIDDNRVQQWRDLTIKRFINSSDARRFMVEFGIVGWRTTTYSLRDFPSRFLSTPKSVAQLAMAIGKVIPDAMCSVHYFYTDPILYIHLPDQQDQCIAIWDKGVVRAIADGVKLPLHQRLLRQFVTIV
jgi:hypothetical protein